MKVSPNNIAFKLYPHKRYQDVIKLGNYITKNMENIVFASIVDGWNNPKEIASDKPGKVVAGLVSKELPILFLKYFEEKKFSLDNLDILGNRVAQEIEQRVLAIYPAHASCCGTFIFDYKDNNIIIAISTISTLLWFDNHWEKPKEIGDYLLDYTKLPSGASHMIGRGELKNNPLYSVKTDVLTVSKNIPIFVATDGLLMQGGIMTLDEMNRFSQKTSPFNSMEFIEGLGKIIEEKRNLQKDDISIFIKVG